MTVFRPLAPLRSLALRTTAGTLAAFLPAVAGTVTLKPAADTTLFSFTPNNNCGKESTLVVGGINKSASACRSLIRFDLSTDLPVGAVITDVSIKLRVTKEKGSSAAIQTQFHRLAHPWIEGTKSGKAGGATAAAGEPTWNARAKGDSNWAKPGGDGDFATMASATIALDNTGTYTILSNDSLLADVRDWQTDSATNFGWILIADKEGTLASARRIASREDSSQAPTLTIGFTVPTPPPPPPVATGRLAADGQFELTFVGKNGSSYEVQARASLDNTPWTTAATLTVAQDGPLTNRVSVGRDAFFFRVLHKP